MKQAILTVLTVLSLTACNKVDYQTSTSGLVYKVFTGKGGEKPTASDYIKYDMEYRLTAKNDSLLNTTFGSFPGYAKVDTSKNAAYSFMELVPKFSPGDSAEILISIDTLKNRGLIPDYNAMFTKGGSIKCKFKLLKVFKTDSAVKADYDNEIEIVKATESKQIEDYLAKNNIKAFKTPGGTYVSIENAGDTSVTADSGYTASVMYRGSLLTNGKVFDTNMDTTKGHTDPYPVAVGQPGIIEGWMQALPYFGKGTKGKIFVPAMNAYGPQAQGADIPAFSNL
ncbi:MAG: FKBP-type peptidyl-prolyl cis-trans isomerase, partial [Ferruginibacter sp.]